MAFEIDKQLERFFSLPFSFDAVVHDIATSNPAYADLTEYIRYLLDDSRSPGTIAATLNPGVFANGVAWDSIVAHYKVILFMQGARDCPASLSAANWSEKDYRRLDGLHEFEALFAAIRLQFKDEIIRELVKSYIEGSMAGREAAALPHPADSHPHAASLADEYTGNRCLNARVKKQIWSCAQGGPLITFFMIVVDPDILIADYCIKSFSRLSGLDFRLAVYCNWVTPANKQKYLPRWRNFPFVEIIEPTWMNGAQPPGWRPAYGFQGDGPFDRPEVPWDVELAQFGSRYHATIDGDFEILQPGFMRAMLDHLENSPATGFVGTDRSELAYFTDDDHPGKNIQQVVVNTWCCLYRRETIDCRVSNFYYRERSDCAGIGFNVWDSSGLRQLALTYVHGYESSRLNPGYFAHFIHYGAFCKNQHLDETNIELWRLLMILRKIGQKNVLGPVVHAQHLARMRQLLASIDISPPATASASQLAQLAYERLFAHVDRANPYKNNWGQLTPVESGFDAFVGPAQ